MGETYQEAIENLRKAFKEFLCAVVEAAPFLSKIVDAINRRLQK